MGSAAFVNFKITSGSKVLIVFRNIIYTTPFIKIYGIIRLTVMISLDTKIKKAEHAVQSYAACKG